MANGTQTRKCNGFAIPLREDTNLGLAMLIAEDEEGHHEPVAVASTINEAKELAECDFRGSNPKYTGFWLLVPARLRPRRASAFLAPGSGQGLDWSNQPTLCCRSERGPTVARHGPTVTFPARAATPRPVRER